MASSRPNPGRQGVVVVVVGVVSISGTWSLAYGLAWNIKAQGKSQRVITYRGTYFYSLT